VSLGLFVILYDGSDYEMKNYGPSVANRGWDYLKSRPAYLTLCRTNTNLHPWSCTCCPEDPSYNNRSHCQNSQVNI